MCKVFLVIVPKQILCQKEMLVLPPLSKPHLPSSWISDIFFHWKGILILDRNRKYKALCKWFVFWLNRAAFDAGSVPISTNRRRGRMWCFVAAGFFRGPSTSPLPQSTERPLWVSWTLLRGLWALTVPLRLPSHPSGPVKCSPVSLAASLREASFLSGPWAVTHAWSAGAGQSRLMWWALGVSLEHSFTCLSTWPSALLFGVRTVGMGNQINLVQISRWGFFLNRWLLFQCLLHFFP